MEVKTRVMMKITEAVAACSRFRLMTGITTEKTVYPTQTLAVKNVDPVDPPWTLEWLFLLKRISPHYSLKFKCKLSTKILISLAWGPLRVVLWTLRLLGLCKINLKTRTLFEILMVLWKERINQNLARDQCEHWPSQTNWRSNTSFLVVSGGLYLSYYSLEPTYSIL